MDLGRRRSGVSRVGGWELQRHEYRRLRVWEKTSSSHFIVEVVDVCERGLGSQFVE